MSMSEFDLTSIFVSNFNSLPGSMAYLTYSELPIVLMHISTDLETQVLDIQIPNKMYAQCKRYKLL